MEKGIVITLKLVVLLALAFYLGYRFGSSTYVYICKTNKEKLDIN